jgi:hypothetical protein
MTPARRRAECLRRRRRISRCSRFPCAQRVLEASMELWRLGWLGATAGFQGSPLFEIEWHTDAEQWIPRGRAARRYGGTVRGWSGGRAASGPPQSRTRWDVLTRGRTLGVLDCGGESAAHGSEDGGGSWVGLQIFPVELIRALGMAGAASVGFAACPRNLQAPTAVVRR